MTDSTPPPSDPAAQVADQFGSPAIPRIYINGFTLGTSLSDVYMLASTAGTPAAVILMSFTTAKTLAKQLGELISDFEKITGQSLLTMEDIQNAASKSDEAGKQ
jgi:hypothetical protein